MKVVVVFDSVYGNTESVAKAIGAAIPGQVQVLRVAEANPAALGPPDLLIVGGPTYGGRISEAMKVFLEGIPADALVGTRVAAFDTRLPTLSVHVFGYAAPKIAEHLQGKGGTLVGSPEGFFVKASEGPLKEGDLERAAQWAKGLVE
jgi:flavodoxin I